MRVAINEGEQLLYRPFPKKIVESLRDRESNKNFVYNTNPFVRINCLQSVSYKPSTDERPRDNFREVSDVISGLSDVTYDGFTLKFDSTFDESYGDYQVIGRTIGFGANSQKIEIKNPRRVPPLSLNQLIASHGPQSGYYSTATISFTCHSLEQLEFITPFLLYPGNYIFIEWGNNSENLSGVDFFSRSDITLFKKSVRGDFNENEQGFYQKFDKNVSESAGNYEYLGGIVGSFDISMNQDLGYECTVTILSTSFEKNIASTIDAGEDTKNLCNPPRETLSEKLLNLETSQKNRTDVSGRQYMLNVRGNKYILLKSLLEFLSYNSYIAYKKGDFPIISYNEDVLIFRTNMYDKVLNIEEIDGVSKSSLVNTVNFFQQPTPINNIQGKSIADVSIDVKYVQVDAPLRGVTSGRFEEVPQRTQQPIAIADVSIKTQKPFLVDDVRGQDSSEYEALSNVYINFDKFYEIYKDSNGVAHDCVKKLFDMIGESTTNKLSLEIIGSSVSAKSVDGNLKEEESSKIISKSSAKLLSEDYYIFKMNSTNSIVQSFNFSINMDGAYTSQIYGSSLKTSDNSAESDAMKLILFDSHEDNIQIKDIRKEIINQSQKKLPKNDINDSDDCDDNAVSTVDVNQVVRSKYLNDIRQNYFSLKFSFDTLNPIKSRYVGVIPQSKINIKPNGVVEIAARDDGSYYNVNDITDAINQIYGVTELPMIFNRAKEKILDNQKSKDSTINPNKSKNNKSLTPLIPNVASMQLLGIGGVNPLTYFRIEGIPSAYSKRGVYIVENVYHSVTPTMWTVDLTCAFRVDDVN